MILLISTSEVLVKAFAGALPTSTPLVHLNTITQMELYLSTLTPDMPEITLVVVDAEADRQIVAACHQLCGTELSYQVPIVAIIAQAADRQTVLEAGADDYLLLPLISSEIRRRLANYLHFASHSLSIWVEAFHQMNKGVASTQVLRQSLEDIARIFDASSAWLFLFNQAGDVQLLGSYNLPLLLQQDATLLDDEGRVCLKIHQYDHASVQVIPALSLLEANQQTELPHYLSIPLSCNQQLIGALNFAYSEPPQISQTERRALVKLGQNLGILLELFHAQEEAQVYATQNAFMVLMARTMNERLELNAILSLSLEQAVPLLNASGGEIWLLSADGQWLEQVSSLSTTSSNAPLPRRATGQGLIGWVAKHGQSLYLHKPSHDDPRFDPRVDQIYGVRTYSLLAVPLRHRETTIGVLAIHKKDAAPFSNPDTVLLEGIANLTASAIANARLMLELRDFADQQRALYEMSKQIAAGLDLTATLNRVLVWIGRLFEVEVGLLWLVDESSSPANGPALQLVAALGVDLPETHAPTISAQQGVVGWVVQTGKAAMVNDPSDDPRFDPLIVNNLGITPRNMIIGPMIHHDQVIGAISMLNKIQGEFNEVDLTLLSIAIEMASVTVGNARLHTQTVTLLKERERLHQQVVQAERLATVGRLTASLSHEINNPMQAIRTALNLARETLNDPQELDTYIQISMEESERVVQLINRLRQIYRPQSDSFETLDLNRLLQEVIAIARKELNRQQVVLDINLAPNLPSLYAIANQLHLVFLSLILNLSDTIGTMGGGQLYLQSSLLSQAIRVELATNVPIASAADWIHIFKTGASQTQGKAKSEEEDISFGLSLSHEIVVSHGGRIDFNQQNGQTVFHIDLPLPDPGLAVEPGGQRSVLR